MRQAALSRCLRNCLRFAASFLFWPPLNGNRYSYLDRVPMHLGCRRVFPFTRNSLQDQLPESEVRRESLIRRDFKMRIVLAIHGVLVLLASTAFTVVTAPLGDNALQWSFWSFSSRSGFGAAYVSDYSLAVMLTYLVAFALGVVGFTMACRNGRALVGGLGVMLSVIGLVSFSIELSHVFVSHQRSWIAISPAAMLVLASIACLSRRDTMPQDLKAVST